MKGLSSPVPHLRWQPMWIIKEGHTNRGVRSDLYLIDPLLAFDNQQFQESLSYRLKVDFSA